MQSLKLWKRITPYLQVRKKAMFFIYALTALDLSLAMAQPLIFAYLIDHVLIEGNTERVVPILSVSLAAALLSASFAVMKGGLIRQTLTHNTLDVRDSLTRHIRKIPIWEIERNGVGKFAAMLGYDAYTLANFLTIVITEIFTQLFMLTMALGLLFYMDWRLGLVTMASIGFMLFIPRLYRKPLTRYAAEVRDHNEGIGTFLYEHIEASKEIRMFGLEQWERERNDAMYKGLVRSSTRETLFQQLSNQSGVLVISFIIAMIYWVGSMQVADGALTVGMLVAAISYLYNVLNPVRAINDTFVEAQRTEIALSRIEAFMAIPNERAAFEDEDEPVREPAQPATAAAVAFHDLYASCYGSQILKGIELNVRPGQVVAFVGRSGAGKTTLVRTIMGFVDIDAGELRIGGKSMRQMNRKAISNEIGTVFQDSYIVEGTLFENIALGKLSATYEEAYEAACHANLQSFIDSLPDGLHTRVDHKGFQLSGGQKQRIAIARVFLKKPSILLLDEPTSALDRQTEDEVMTALHNVMKGKTTLISSHKLSTLTAVDYIYVMEQGKIVESGTFEELIRHSITFSEIMREHRTEEEHHRMPYPPAPSMGAYA